MQEYVCADAIALKPKYIHGSDIYHLGFGKVIISLVCWSTSPSVGMVYTDQAAIHRGVWAGRRFDITIVRRYEEGIERGRDTRK